MASLTSILGEFARFGLPVGADLGLTLFGVGSKKAFAKRQGVKLAVAGAVVGGPAVAGAVGGAGGSGILSAFGKGAAGSLGSSLFRPSEKPGFEVSRFRQRRDSGSDLGITTPAPARTIPTQQPITTEELLLRAFVR